MFVRDFIHVTQPFELVGPRFVSDTTWLAPIAEQAADVARDVAMSLLGSGSPAAARPRQPDRARGEIGPLRARSTSILIPMWLLNERGDPALPDLAGDLEVAPVGTGRSLIAFDATYQRPTHDPEVLSRVERATEAGVRTFLGGIAAALDRPAPAV